MNDKTVTSMEIKQFNKDLIFQFIRKHGMVSKRDVQMGLELSLPTTTQHINELIKDGLVKEAGTVGNTGGRSAKTYTAVNDARISVGIDITKNHTSFVAVDLTGNTICFERVAVSFVHTEEYFSQLGAALDKFVEDNKLDKKRILGVGIGVPGITTEDNKLIRFGDTIGLSGVTVDTFSKYIRYETKLINDANAAGFSEVWTHNSPPNMFYILLSSFVGGAVIIDNKVYSGDEFRSGEVGHVIIHNNGRQCYCGQKGCADAYLASTNLSDTTDGNLELFFENVKNGEANAIKVWNEYLHDLALVVRDIRMLFNCKIVIGGYVGKYMNDYIEQFKKLMKSYCTFDSDADYVMACKYKGSPIAAGAALSYIDDFLKANN